MQCSLIDFYFKTTEALFNLFNVEKKSRDDTQALVDRRDSKWYLDEDGYNLYVEDEVHAYTGKFESDFLKKLPSRSEILVHVRRNDLGWTYFMLDKNNEDITIKEKL